VEDLKQIAQRDRRGERAGRAAQNPATAQNKKGLPVGQAFNVFSTFPTD
jgi:hypothetical protein